MRRLTKNKSRANTAEISKPPMRRLTTERQAIHIIQISKPPMRRLTVFPVTPEQASSF